MRNIFGNLLSIVTDPKFYKIIIVVVIFVAIGYFAKHSAYRNLAETGFHIGSSKFDLWSLSHVLLYMYFGYYFSDYFIEFLIIGTAWELFECTPCSREFLKLINCDLSRDKSSRDNLVCQLIKKINNCDYWYGKWEDIIMNTLGFVIGVWLAKRSGKTNNRR